MAILGNYFGLFYKEICTYQSKNIWKQLWPSDIRGSTKGALFKARAKT